MLLTGMAVGGHLMYSPLQHMHIYKHNNPVWVLPRSWGARTAWFMFSQVSRWFQQLQHPTCSHHDCHPLLSGGAMQQWGGQAPKQRTSPKCHLRMPDP